MTRSNPTLAAAKASTFRYEVDEAGCWIWQGYCDPNGYARIYNRHKRRIEWAHRFSYEQHIGPISDGYEIDHMCQVVKCVNPEHLQQLTRAEHARVTMTRLGKDDLHRTAALMRTQGYTYSEIAAALGYMGKESSHGAVLAAIKKGLIDADEVPRATHLNEIERQDIADLSALGIPHVVIGELYGLHNSQVSRVSRGLTSGHRRSA